MKLCAALGSSLLATSSIIAALSSATALATGAASDSRVDDSYLEARLMIFPAGTLAQYQLISNRSLRTAVSVSGKRDFTGRDKGAATAPQFRNAFYGDQTRTREPAHWRLLERRREISGSARVRGGAERTRTPCQARSRYRTGLSRVIHRGNSAL